MYFVCLTFTRCRTLKCIRERGSLQDSEGVVLEKCLERYQRNLSTDICQHFLQVLDFRKSKIFTSVTHILSYISRGFNFTKLNTSWNKVVTIILYCVSYSWDRDFKVIILKSRIMYYARCYNRDVGGYELFVIINTLWISRSVTWASISCRFLSVAVSEYMGISPHIPFVMVFALFWESAKLRWLNPLYIGK